MRFSIVVGDGGHAVRRTIRARDRAHAEAQAEAIAAVESRRDVELGEAVLRHLQDERR